VGIGSEQIDEAQRVKTEPLEKQLAYLLGSREINSWRDLEQEFGSKIRMIDRVFFLDKSEFEEYQVNQQTYEQLERMGISLYDMPTHIFTTDSRLLREIERRRERFLKNAQVELHQQQIRGIFIEYAEKLASEPLAYDKAKTHLASLGDRLPTAVERRWASSFDEYNDKVAAVIEKDFETRFC